jgi:hypothetical protein
VAVVQAVGEVAAGGRGPAGLGQFADVVDQQLGQFAQARGVVGKVGAFMPAILLDSANG